MQQNISTSHGGLGIGLGLGLIKCMSSPIFDKSDGFDYASPIFSAPKTSLLSVLIPSDDDTSNNITTTTPITADHRQTFDRQDLVNRHNLCLSHLHEAARDAESLRQENINLRVANIDLTKRLKLLLLQVAAQNGFAPPSDYSTPSPSPSSVKDAFRMFIGEIATSAIESDRVEKIDVGRISQPNSISVRSSGYLKTVEAGGMKISRVRMQNRLKTVNPVNGMEKVCVGGGKKEQKKKAVELEAYNQGMIKTELCDKWQMTGGTCPYGNHCQFAHGIEELRPVIRHPRYKTEVCRIILSGQPCPYGHRCHFRHTLTHKEKPQTQLW